MPACRETCSACRSTWPGASGNVGLWAVSADGERFLFNRPLHEESAWLPIAVFGWMEEMKR